MSDDDQDLISLMAAQILGHLVSIYGEDAWSTEQLAEDAVLAARAIVAEVRKNGAEDMKRPTVGALKIT